MTELPIVDAHQHFWDLERNYLPWLCDPQPIPFRYGNYDALRRSYLPEDYFRDAAGHDVVKTVYVETEWDPADPVGETRWLAEIIAASGFPHGIVAGARLDDPDVEAVLAGHAGFPRVRGIRHKPKAAAVARSSVERGAPGSMGDPAWRRGYALLEKYGLSFDLQTPWWHLGEAAALARDFPQTQIILNHTGLPADRSAGGPRRLARGDGDARRRAQRRGQDLGPRAARASRGRSRPTGRSCATRSRSSASSAACSPATSRSTACAPTFDTIFAGFKAIVADRAPADQRRLFHDNAVRIYRLDERAAIRLTGVRGGRTIGPQSCRHQERQILPRGRLSCSPVVSRSRWPPAAPFWRSAGCPARPRPRPTSR